MQARPSYRKAQMATFELPESKRDPLMPDEESGQSELKTETDGAQDQIPPAGEPSWRLSELTGKCVIAAFFICVLIIILGTFAGLVSLFVYLVRKWTSDEDGSDAVTFAPDNFTDSMQ